MATTSSLKKIVIEGSVDSKIVQKISKDATVDPVMKILLRNRIMYRSLILKQSNIDVSCVDLISHKDEELTNFEMISEIKQQRDMLGGDDLVVPWCSIRFLIRQSILMLL